MRDVYTAKLSRLSDEILEMGNLCGQAIMKTCQLLASVEIREAATKEIGRIEKEIDDKEHNIEALCMQLLLKQQPLGPMNAVIFFSGISRLIFFKAWKLL